MGRAGRDEAPGGRDYRRPGPVLGRAPRRGRRRRWRAPVRACGGHRGLGRRRLHEWRRRRHPVLMPPRGGERERQQSGRKRPSSTGPIRKKSCYFCKEKVEEIDYKNANQLRRYVSEKGKIRSRRITGACRRHQRQVAVAIKRAREMALLPYVADGR